MSGAQVGPLPQVCALGLGVSSRAGPAGVPRPLRPRSEHAQASAPPPSARSLLRGSLYLCALPRPLCALPSPERTPSLALTPYLALPPAPARARLPRAPSPGAPPPDLEPPAARSCSARFSPPPRQRGGGSAAPHGARVPPGLVASGQRCLPAGPQTAPGARCLRLGCGGAAQVLR